MVRIYRAQDLLYTKLYRFLQGTSSTLWLARQQWHAKVDLSTPKLEKTARTTCISAINELEAAISLYV